MLKIFVVSILIVCGLVFIASIPDIIDWISFYIPANDNRHKSLYPCKDLPIAQTVDAIERAFAPYDYSISELKSDELRLTWHRYTGIMGIQILKTNRIIFHYDSSMEECYQFHTDEYDDHPRGPRKRSQFKKNMPLITEIMTIARSFMDASSTCLESANGMGSFKNSKLEMYYQYTGHMIGWTPNEQDFFIKYKDELVLQCHRSILRGINAWLEPEITTFKKGSWIDYMRKYDDVSFAPLNVIEQLLND